MMNTNHNNSGCGFSEQLVSYLYGESNAAETAVFEQHLHNCAVCGDEYESFSGVKFSLGDWKQKNFANLATPLIVIPYPQKPDDVKGSWLANLRGLFGNASAAWSLSAASLFVVFACVALFFVFSNSKSPDFIVQNNSNPIASPTPPKEERIPANSRDEVSPPETTVNRTPKSSVAPKTGQIETTSKSDSQNNRVVKVSNNAARTPKIETSNTLKNDVKRNKLNKTVVPKINDDEEDNSLRLAELFDELDTK